MNKDKLFMSDIVKIIALFVNWIRDMLHLFDIHDFDDQFSNALEELE